MPPKNGLVAPLLFFRLLSLFTHSFAPHQPSSPASSSFFVLPSIPSPVWIGRNRYSPSLLCFLLLPFFTFSFFFADKFSRASLQLISTPYPSFPASRSLQTPSSSGLSSTAFRLPHPIGPHLHLYVFVVQQWLRFTFATRPHKGEKEKRKAEAKLPFPQHLTRVIGIGTFLCTRAHLWFKSVCQFVPRLLSFYSCECFLCFFGGQKTTQDTRKQNC